MAKYLCTTPARHRLGSFCRKWVTLLGCRQGTQPVGGCKYSAQHLTPGMPLQLFLSPCIAGSNGTLSGTPATVPSWLRQGETSGENIPLPTSPSGSAGGSQAVDCASQTGSSSEVGGKSDRQTDLFLLASGLPPIPGHLVQAIKDHNLWTSAIYSQRPCVRHSLTE